MDYIRKYLGHEPGCPAGDPNLIPFKPDGSFGDPGPCTCPRAKELARIEAMEAFVESYRYAAHVRSGAHARVTIVLAERAVDDAFAKLEGT